MNARKQMLHVLGLCVAGVVLNVAGSRIPGLLGIPLFLDNIGTITTAVLGGYLPGITIGYITNLINGIHDPTTAYYCILTVLIAVTCTWMYKKGFFDKWYRLIAVILALAAIGGGLGSILTWLLYGYGMGEGISAPFTRQLYETGKMSLFWAQFLSDISIDLVDKTVTVVISVILLRFVPEKLKSRFVVEGWRQTPLTNEERKVVGRDFSKGMGLRSKILVIIAVITLFIAVVTTGISFFLYHSTTLNDHILQAKTIAQLAATAVDGGAVDRFLEKGESAKGYIETENELKEIKGASPDIEYVYVYQILEDGCHVVFDLDTPEVKGAEPGEIIPFDESFSEYIPNLLRGEDIDVVISDETFGWLLTAYKPIRDSSGACKAYAAVDISMDRVRMNEVSFIAKVVALFFGFFILILAIGLFLAEYNLIMPINTMALASSEFATNSEASREESVERMERIGINTGDELENLYHAVTSTMRETVGYITDVQNKSETITQMQNGLILVLADMVESRDKCTGDHVRKTAAYTRVIMDQMRKNGDYTDILTDEFVSDVENSAPLHDVGKIKVSDMILNKPGKLTDEEFEEMKKHTVYGKEVIEQAIRIVPDSEYLREAQNLAAYHHEKWNGMGYPEGLAGEAIPLSARIMAVADVFDALVSRRSYKDPFPYEKARDIIRKDAGSHFDPTVAKAFLEAEEEVRRVYETHYETSAGEKGT